MTRWSAYLDGLIGRQEAADLDELEDEVITLRAQVKVLQNWINLAKKLGFDPSATSTCDFDPQGAKIARLEAQLARARALGFNPDDPTYHRPGSGLGGLA